MLASFGRPSAMERVGLQLWMVYALTTGRRYHVI